MREYILQQLRECSCVRGKQRTWVSDLTDERLYELFLRLRNGENAKTIARFVQKGWGVNPKATAHSISQGIIKFKKRVAHLLITPTTERGNKFSGYSTQDFTSEDTLESLDHIANLQRARIKAMLEEEEKTGIKYPYLNRDLQALSTLQKLIIKQKTWEKFNDDPVKQRKMAGLQMGIERKFGAEVDKMGEEGKLKMVNALGRFLELCKENAEVVEVGPDGKLRLVEPI